MDGMKCLWSFILYHNMCPSPLLSFNKTFKRYVFVLAEEDHIAEKKYDIRNMTD